MSSAGDIIGIAASAVVVLGAVVGAIRWFIRHELGLLRAEFKPNGGGSFRDHVDDRFDGLDERLNGVDDRMNGIDDRLTKIEIR